MTIDLIRFDVHVAEVFGSSALQFGECQNVRRLPSRKYPKSGTKGHSLRTEIPECQK